MRKLLLLIICLGSLVCQGQTKSEFFLLINGKNTIITLDTTYAVIAVDTLAIRRIGGRKYVIDIVYCGLFSDATLVSWSESWKDASRRDIIDYLTLSGYYLKSSLEDLWVGNFAKYKFIAVPQYNWSTDSWFLQHTIIAETQQLTKK